MYNNWYAVRVIGTNRGSLSLDHVFKLTLTALGLMNSPGLG